MRPNPSAPIVTDGNTPIFPVVSRVVMVLVLGMARLIASGVAPVAPVAPVATPVVPVAPAVPVADVAPASPCSPHSRPVYPVHPVARFPRSPSGSQANSSRRDTTTMADTSMYLT